MTKKEKIKVEFNALPDGFGFLYGTATNGIDTIPVNVIPPKSEWQGDMVLKNFEPEEGVYQVLVDGEIIARVEKHEEIGSAIFPKIEK